MQSPEEKNLRNSTAKLTAILFTAICALSLVIIRIALFNFDWGDYSLFLQPWVMQYRGMTFFEGLGTKVGNYNHPYMYLLNIIARINFSDLYLIKSISVIFDFVLAFFVMKIVSLRTASINLRILAFLLTLAIPTVVLNSSMWGQCDSIYSAFAIGSVYFGLKGRSKLAYVFIALAFSFKLQTVFLLPIFPIFILKGKISFKDCYIFFAVYLATLLPAIFAGMPFGDVFSAYITQTGYYSSLNMNIVNIWRLVGPVDYESFRLVGLHIAGLAAIGLMYFTYANRTRLTSNTDYIRLAYLFAIIMPFLLPNMHDRYYFMADALSLLVFLFDKRRWFVPIVTIFCSYLSYAYFLMSGVVLLDFRIAAIALFFVIIIVLRDYVMSVYPSNSER